MVDYDLIKFWLGVCYGNHACRRLHSISVPGFKVIDCASRKILPGASGCRYVALSYVWGTDSAAGQCPEGSLPSPLPRVIEDSLTVAPKLGFHYVWVDRYCIDQENKEEKHTQISNMDVIYKGAVRIFSELFTLNSMSRELREIGHSQHSYHRLE